MFSMPQTTRRFHVVLERQEEGGFTAYIPELPGCISQGDDEKEALANIREAKELYLDALSSTELRKAMYRVKVLEAVA